MRSPRGSDVPILRPGTNRDVAAMADVHAACWRLVFAAAVTPDVTAAVPAQSVDQFSSWFGANSASEVTVAQIDGDLVGYAATSGHHVLHLFVDPGRWRRGIGGLLLADAEERIRSDGHVIAELHTRVGNDPAIALYRSAGWELTDELVPCDDHGVVVDEHVMVKRLR